jgi:hypothetical protein
LTLLVSSSPVAAVPTATASQVETTAMQPGDYYGSHATVESVEVRELQGPDPPRRPASTLRPTLRSLIVQSDYPTKKWNAAKLRIAIRDNYYGEQRTLACYYSAKKS